MTEDIGMDRNPRAIPARAAAQTGIVVGIVMALVAGVIVILALVSPDVLTLARDVPVWPVAGGVAVAGVILAVSSVILLRRVQKRDRNRSIAGGPADAASA